MLIFQYSKPGRVAQAFQLNIDDLGKEKISELKDIFSLHQGNHTLNFVVYDSQDKLKLTMPSRKQKVKISQELLYELQELDVMYKLN